MHPSRGVLLALALIGGAASCGAGDSASSDGRIRDEPSLRVELIGWGNAREPDGFALTIGQEAFNVQWNGVVTVAPKSAAVVITLTGIGSHCQADQGSRSVTPSGGADTVRIAIGCFGDFAFNEQLPNEDWRMRYMDVLGQVRPVAEAPGRQIVAEWSPDGTRIVYRTNERGDLAITSLTSWDIAQVNPATGVPVWLATSPTGDFSPKWSPDGTRVAYNRAYYRSGGLTDSVVAYLVNADGTGERTLLPAMRLDLDPDWVLGGGALVFGCDRFYYLGGICLTSSAGGQITALVPEQWSAQAVEASPHGDWVSYWALGEFQSIWTIPVSGGIPRRVSPGVWTYFARWHPGGMRLAVSTVEGSNPYTYGLRVIERDGSNPTPNLVAFSPNVGPASWSTDGEWLAVSAVVGTDQNIFVLRPDGSGRRQITFGPSYKFNVQWRPTSQFIPPPTWVTFAGAVSPPPASAVLQDPARRGECVGMTGRVVGRVPCEGSAYFGGPGGEGGRPGRAALGERRRY